MRTEQILKDRTKHNIICFVLSILLFVCVLSITSCSKSTNNGTGITDNKKLYVDFISVGKGDCSLIRTANGNYMIDTGYDNTSDTMLDFLKTKNVTELDGLIITHFDKDHVGGASDLIKKINVKKIYVPNYTDDGEKYLEFIDTIQKKGYKDKVQTVTSDLELKLGDIKLTIYPSKKNEYKTVNNYSMITKVVNQKDSFLFAADAEKARLNEVLGSDYIKADVLKVPYHGILGKKSIEFINEVAPKFAVITCESKEDASVEILNALKDINAKTYLNCDGNISMVSDGTGNVTVTQK